MVTDSTNGTGKTPVSSSDADATSSDSAAGQRTQIAQADGQPVIVARQIAQAGDQAPLLAMLPQAGEWVIIKVEPGSAVQLPADLAQFTGHEVNGNLELTLPNGGVVVLEGFVAAASSGTPPELLTAEGKPIDLAEFLVAVGVAPEALHVAQHETPPPTIDHGGHFSDGPGPQILGGLNPTGAIEATELLFPVEAQIKEEVGELIKHEPPPEAPRALEFSVTDATVIEGQVAVFTVSYTGDTLAPGQTATIHVATGPGFTGSSTDATPGSDYNPVGIDLTFTGGQPTALTVGVSTIDDTIVEGPEDFTLVLSAPSQGTIIHSPGDGVIVDNNDASNLHWSIIADSTVTEGNAAAYTVGYTGATLATGITETITVATGAGFTGGFSDATVGADYTGINTVITFTGGQPATQTISVGTINDTIVEGPEDYTIGISGASGGTITQPQANGVIVDDNDASRLNWSIVNDSTVTEGGSATYTIGYTGATLAPGVTETITVATGAGWTAGFSDAAAGADYTAINTVLTFTGGGATTQTVAVNTIDDTIVEGPEDYTVGISGASAGTIVHGQTNDVIVDNGDSSRLQWSIISDTTTSEGGTATYTVGYTGAPLATGVTETITVATGAGYTSGFSDAVAGADYTGINTVLTFTGGGSTTQTVAVNTVDDTIVEGPEDYTVGISGQSAGTIVPGQGQTNDVIIDNGDGSRLQWSIVSDATVTEGGTATYTVGYTGAPLATGMAETQDVYLDDQRKISEQARVSWNSVTTSHENVIELQKTVVANTQTRDAYIQQFDIGQRGLLDLLNEDNELYLSRDNLVTATFAETFARFRLLAVAGGLEKALSVSPPEQAAVPVEQ